MLYKVGSLVTCEVEIRPNGGKYVLTREPDPKSSIIEGEFEIIGYDKRTECYTIAIPHDMIGWIVNQFHIEHGGIAAKHKGKRFWDINENYIVDRVAERIANQKAKEPPKE